MSLLRRNRAFRRLWLARLVSFLGDSLGLVALIVHVAATTDSGAAVGLLLLAGDFVPSLFSPVLGALADRGDGRRTMIVCELGQAVLVGAIVLLSPSIAVVLVLFAARSLLSSTFQAASRSAIADLVDDADLEVANATVGFATHGLELIGPLAAAALLVVLDPLDVLAVDALTFVVSPLLLAGLPRVRIGVERGAMLTQVRDGLSATRRHRSVWVLAAMFWAVALFGAADDAALPFLVTDELGGGDAAVALLYGAGGAGLVVGFLVLARRRPAAAAVAVIGAAVGSAGNALTGLAPALAVAWGWQSVRGFGNAWHGVGVDTVIQREVPPRERGRVFANVYGGVGFAAGVSYVAGGALVDSVGPRVVLVGGGAVGVACAAWAAHRHRVLGALSAPEGRSVLQEPVSGLRSGVDDGRGTRHGLRRRRRSTTPRRTLRRSRDRRPGARG